MLNDPSFTCLELLSQKSISQTTYSFSTIQCCSVLNLIIVKDEKKHFTSGINKKQSISRKWSHEQTALFYEGLAMFGLDFSMIQSMIPSRSKKEIASKYKRQSKENNQKVDKYVKQSWKDQGWLKHASQ